MLALTAGQWVSDCLRTIIPFAPLPLSLRDILCIHPANPTNAANPSSAFLHYIFKSAHLQIFKSSILLILQML
jgi:hypothetical protein